MAAALVDFARGHGVEPKPERVENYQNFPGEGISGKIGDNELYIGNWRIASRAGCSAGKSLNIPFLYPLGKKIKPNYYILESRLFNKSLFELDSTLISNKFL